MPADPSEAARQPASSTRTHSEESSQSRNHKTATDDCRLQYDRVSEIICPPPDHGRSPALTSRSDFRIDVEQAPTIGARGFLEGHSSLFRAAFIVTALSTQVLSQGQFGMVIVPLYAIGEWLGTTDPGQLSWMAASNGLTVGMFLVMSGRLGDIVGPKLMWVTGILIMVVSNVASGCVHSPIAFDIVRAVAGIGAAFSVPNAVAILTRTFPPGRTRSYIIAAFGALAPAGWLTMGAISALCAQLISVPSAWFVTAGICAAIFTVGIFVLPPDDMPSAVDTSSPKPSIRILALRIRVTIQQLKTFDFIGTCLLVVGLGFFNFTWNQLPAVPASTAYIYVCLAISLAALVTFYFWERRIGRSALIPTEVLKRDSILVYICLYLGWTAFGVFLFYTTLFLHNIRGVTTPLGIAAQMAPVGPAGVLAACAVPWLLKTIAPHQIFLISMLAFMVGNVMAAVAPVHGYWSVTFPSLLLVISGPDMSFATGQLIVSNSVDREFQGIAGGVVSLITNYSLSIGLGMAGVVERYSNGSNGTLLEGYRSAFYFGTGLAALAVVVVGLFVRMEKQNHID